MKMDKTRILSGEAIVSKGALRINSTLPEAGVKDVSPNRSWLEQKQIQTALENRKQFLEIERIEKSGVLSHAEWRNDLMLAKVTQKVGGYWQYLGHNIGKDSFLNPEEVLFLMEINCLVLYYNEVKVSLQQAYAMLLPTEEKLMQYKVYASLSRLGYKVYRHRGRSETGSVSSEIAAQCEKRLKLIIQSIENEDVITINDLNQNESIHTCTDHKDVINDKSVTIIPKIETDILAEKDIPLSSNCENLIENINNSNSLNYIENGIERLKSRKRRSLKHNICHNSLEDLPEFFKHPTVTINVPDKRYLPGKINITNDSYVLNVERMRTKSTTSSKENPTPTPINAATQPINNVYESYVNCVRHVPSPDVPRYNVWGESFNIRFATQTNVIRNFCVPRPQANLSYFHLNMTFQRPFQHIPQFRPRIMMNPLMQHFVPAGFLKTVVSANENSANNLKRCRKEIKKQHFDSITEFVTNIKKIISVSKVTPNSSVARLKHLIQSYNVTYKTKLKLTENFDIVLVENVVDTIDLDEDEPKAKKIASGVGTSLNNKLERLERLAAELKSVRNEVTSRHRRMISKLIKRFNSSYYTDYYLNNNFDLINRNDLTEETSSDTDVIEQTCEHSTNKKKLKNPFSILRLLSNKQRQEESQPSTSKEEVPCKRLQKYSNSFVKTFKAWLPDVKDFGRAEIISNKVAKELIDVRKEEFLFDFFKLQPDKFKSWYELKMTFLKSLKDTFELFHDEAQNRTYIDSLVKPEDFVDVGMVLKKLSIIKNHNTFASNDNLEIHFDVYNKDVQNFKKSNRPLPHFRVVCLKESSTLPSGADVASLHSKYKDDVVIIFAVVGSGSISYLQINPIDLPIYMSSINNTV